MMIDCYRCGTTGKEIVYIKGRGRRFRECSECDGYDPTDDEDLSYHCEACDGKGGTYFPSIPGHHKEVDCTLCYGAGRIEILRKCSLCHGKKEYQVLLGELRRWVDCELCI